MRSEGRQTDVAARWGGDECILIAPKTDAQTGVELADRIRRRIAERLMRWSLTVSVGAATAEPHTAAWPSALLRAADSAMYDAKRRGKNRTSRCDLSCSFAPP